MNCILRPASSDNVEKLRQHCIVYHKIDKDNKFFQKLFSPTKKRSILRKCLRCDGFLSTEKFKVKHDFLKHYADGQNFPFEDKPIEVLKTGGIRSYEISVNKQRNYYNLENVEQVVDDFLKNIRSRFQPKGDILLKCGFMIENIQHSVNENFTPIIIDTRYWSTEPYKTKYCNCNGYVFYGLRENILKRVIRNGKSGS